MLEILTFICLKLLIGEIFRHGMYFPLDICTKKLFSIQTGWYVMHHNHSRQILQIFEKSLGGLDPTLFTNIVDIVITIF